MVCIVLPDIFGAVIDGRSFISTKCSCKILRDATPKSLVILDGEPTPLRFRVREVWAEIYLLTELGRGTSTYDGMAIAGVGDLFRPMVSKTDERMDCSGSATPTCDAHAVLIFLRHSLRFVNGRFCISSKHPKHAHEDDGG